LVTKNVLKGTNRKRKGIIMVYVEPELKAAFEAHCKGERITMSSCLERYIYDTVNRGKNNENSDD